MADENLHRDSSLAYPASGDPHPQSWLWSAERLLYAGQVLWDVAANSWPPQPGTRRHPAAAGQHGTAFLLFGYAFENAIKGLITQQLAAEGTPVRRNENGELVGIPTRGHKLSAWATDAGLRLDPDERDLLDRLGEYVYWAGRYPVMKNASGFSPGQLVPNTLMHPDTDRLLVDLLFEKLVANYDSQQCPRLSQIG